jgi:hypothetical protein
MWRARVLEIEMITFTAYPNTSVPMGKTSQTLHHEPWALLSFLPMKGLDASPQHLGLARPTLVRGQRSHTIGG